MILVDEGTSATNCINGDHRMQDLVSKKKEPVTLFIDKVSRLLIDYGVSTIPAIGRSGDYYDVADCVFRMVEYKPAADRRE